MMLLFGEYWINTNAVRGIFFDTDKKGAEFAVVMWAGTSKNIADDDGEMFLLIPGQTQAALLRLQADRILDAQ